MNPAERPNLSIDCERLWSSLMELAEIGGTQKGGVCRIDFDVLPPKGVGRLRWFVTPKILRKLG